MNTEAERYLASLEEKLFHAIKAAIELTRGEFDVQALAEAIANQDDDAISAALDIAHSSFTGALDAELKNVFDLAFEVAGIMAAKQLGQLNFRFETTSLVLRDNLRFVVTSNLNQNLKTAAIQSVKSMHTNDEPPRKVARFIVQNIGLSGAQQKSLGAFRSMLIRGQRRSTTYFPAAQLRRLNASQRSILRSIVPHEVSDDDVERLTNQQRRIMENHRALTTARNRAYELYHTAQQATWEQLSREGKLVGFKRFWITAGDERVRSTHHVIPGLNNEGRGLQEPFSTPLGKAHLPPIEINCRCRIELRKSA